MASSSESSGTGLGIFATSRLKLERKDWQNPPDGLTLMRVSDNLQIWDIEVKGLPGTLYANETYQLQVQIPQNYPYLPPKVIFMDPVPIHPQVYRDGHICWDALYDNWTPDMGISSICHRILIMLTIQSVKKKPKDNQKCPHGRSNCLTNRRRTI